MKRLQVLIVTRRYWPHCDDAASRLTTLVSGLRRQGCFPTVVTPRYHSSWPVEIDHREIPVLRPLSAPRGDWSLARYVRNLSKWLRERLTRYHVVYCDLMRDESAMVVELARRMRVPCVVRCGTLMGSSDIVWQASMRSRKAVFSRCLSADAVIAPRASSQQAILAAGGNARPIVRIADGIGDPVRRTTETRNAARKALAQINHDLCVPVDGNVILCMNRLSPEGGVSSLIKAIWPLLDQETNLRLWLVGDGAWRSRIYSEIKSNGIGKSAFIPGSFDHLDDLMHAADLFVLPSASNGVESFWPTAIAAALPSVIVDCAETRAFAGSVYQELNSFPSNSLEQMRERIEWILGNMDDAISNAQGLRTRLSASVPLADTITRHVQLFNRLVESNNVRDVSGATG